uniref:Uncharacterized protein n=1 Tax=Magallana gigas TaxID=29159 RepID=K1P866_MAGGI
MLNISIVNQRLPFGGNKTMFEIDDVLQLQCTGEVENINAISKNDTNLEFMCESRYGPVCGAQGINLTLSVPTILKSTGG